MKKKFLFIIVLCCALFLNACSLTIGQENSHDREPSSSTNSPDYFKAAWVTTAWGIDFPLNATTSSIKLKQELDKIVTDAAAAGLNALFFQVRPSADAFYKSQLFPWSKFLTGKQGQAPDNNFDPLSYIIEKSHGAGLQLHAWINPFRVTTLTTDKLVQNHPAALNPWLTINIDGKLYFNPGELSARELIINGVREIVENYNVDGIHFDDYFYPEGVTTEDADTFNNRLSNINNIADWRRDNVNQLVYQTYLAVKEINPNVAFGISPSGIWANKSSNSLGSDTRGFQSYYEIYADSRAWVKNGWVDYIAPQIYWYIGQSGSNYLTVLNWWRDVCSDTAVALYVGLGGYKQDIDWLNSQEFANQVAYASDFADGFIIFSFGDIYKNNVLYTIL